MKRTLLVVLATSAVTIAFAPTAAAIPPPLEYAENVARGVAFVQPCAAEGVGASGDLDTQWTLVYRSRNGGSTSTSGTGPVFAGAVTGPCTLPDCWQATLYANGRAVHSTLWYC